jgi:hypothetical protein
MNGVNVKSEVYKIGNLFKNNYSIFEISFNIKQICMIM